MTQAHYKHLLPSEHNGCKTARAGAVKTGLLHQRKKRDANECCHSPEEYLYRRVPITEFDHGGLLLLCLKLFDREADRMDKTLGRTLDV